MEALRVNDADFENVVLCSKGKKLLVIGTQWCQDTTNFLQHVLPSFIEKYGSLVKFFYAEIEGEERGVRLNPAIHDRFEIEAYPTIITFIDSGMIEKKVADNRSQQMLIMRIMLNNLH